MRQHRSSRVSRLHRHRDTLVEVLVAASDCVDTGPPSYGRVLSFKTGQLIHIKYHDIIFCDLGTS